MTDVLIDARRGAGSNLEILYGTVTWKPTLTHSRGTSIVLPAPTTFDLVDGQVVATNVQPTPEPVEGQIEWAYEVTFKDRHGKTFSFLVGVPDSTTQVNFVSLPRYFETKPPLFGQGPQGVPGEAATIEIGSVSSGATPSVNNSGTNSDAVLDFVLPKGDKGDTGTGVPDGGSALQVIRKNAGNTTTEWVTPTKALVGLGNVDNTSDLEKPLSNPQKEYVDSSNVLPYRSRAASDSLSLYPEGVTTGLFSVSDGWPSIRGASHGFAVVSTYRAGGFGTGIQYASAYISSELVRSTPSPILYRSGSITYGWGEWQELETKTNASSINVKDFGAAGDGTADDTSPILLAFSMGEGRTVTFPAGEYKVSTLTGISTSNMRIVGEPGAEIVSTSGGTILEFTGNVTEEKPLLWNIGAGSNVIVVGTDHGLVVGDWIYIKSQRDALGPSAGDEWQLGYATPGSQGCYFAEFLQVSELPGSDRVIVRQPVLFPSYRTDDSQESGLSRPRSTWQKVNFLSNVHVEGLSLRAGGTGFRTRWAKNVTFSNCRWDNPNLSGAMVMFQDSLDCEAVDCKGYYDTRIMVEASHHVRNTFKVAGSHGCGFVRCHAENGTQPFDFTYFGGGAPTVDGYMINCSTRNAQSNGMTSHGGTYKLQVINNRFHCLRNGPSVRTRNAIISGNLIEGAGPASSQEGMGIYLYEGWARDCVITDNVITNMLRGITIRDAVDEGETFKYVGAVISGNNISKVRYGITTSRSSASNFTGDRGIIIDGNHINFADSAGQKIGVWLGRGYRGVKITNNIIRSATTDTESHGIWFDPDCTHNEIYRNTFVGLYYGLRGPTEAEGRIYLGSNIFGTTASARRYALPPGIQIWDGGFWGTTPSVQRPSPPDATGDDADVINLMLSRLRAIGIFSS